MEVPVSHCCQIRQLTQLSAILASCPLSKLYLHANTVRSIADIIELGVPFTDPIADGPTIQTANTKALANGVTVTSVLEMVRSARNRGLKAPLLLMGYYNPMLRYGEERMLKDCKEVGVNGFIMVDLPPEEAVRFRDLCTSNGYVQTP
jgi:tryptophan synthase